MSGLLVLGGLGWLAGVVLLENGVDIDSWPRVPLGLGATLAGLGFFGLRRGLPATGRVGAILCAVTCLLMGVSMVVGSFLSFLVLYWGGLFVLPVAALVLGLGMVRGGGLPWWGSAPVLLIPAVGVVTYGFHTLARETWDPPDVVYFTTLGVAWALLGWANRYMSRRVTPA